MTDRYVRQNKYTLGGGPVATAAATVMGNSNLQANSDENIRQKKIDSVNNKQQQLKNVMTTIITSNNNNCNGTNFCSSNLQPQQDNFSTNRNALGDISNKSSTTNAAAVYHLQKNMIMSNNTNKLGFVVQQQQQTTTTTTINGNNTCIMEEEVSSSAPITEDDTESEEVEIDDDEEVDDDEQQQQTEIMAEVEEEEELEEEEEESIIDIDEFDSENTQLVSEYVKDIYAYLRQVEKQNRISGQFLQNKIVTSKMRAVLIDWLIQVHLKFHLLQETLYLCVQIIDAYLQVQDVPKMHLQLVGVTAMFVASKYEEMYVPAIDDFVYMTDNTYTKAEIRHMEISILKTLNFMFCKPLPLHFLRRFSKAGQADPKQHTLAKYFMELSLHDAEFSSWDPSYLAACSLCLSFRLLNGPQWTRQLEYYSCYKQTDLLTGIQKILLLVLTSSDSSYKYRAVYNKYSASKMMRISQIPELGRSHIRENVCPKFQEQLMLLHQQQQQQ